MIKLVWRPSVNAALRRIAVTMSLIVAAPVLAAPQAGQRKPQSDRKTQTVKQARIPAPAVQPVVTPSPAAMADTTSQAVMTPPATNPMSSGAARQDVAPVNPYLAGWFRSTSVSELPNLAAQQLGTSAQWAIRGVTGMTSLPGQLVDALPSIKRVFPTGGRELWVLNVKCPAEMLAGQYFFPANALRDAVNGLLGTLNESQLLMFDIQLVCT